MCLYRKDKDMHMPLLGQGKRQTVLKMTGEGKTRAEILAATGLHPKTVAHYMAQWHRANRPDEYRNQLRGGKTVAEVEAMIREGRGKFRDDHAQRPGMVKPLPGQSALDKKKEEERKRAGQSLAEEFALKVRPIHHDYNLRAMSQFKSRAA